MIAAASQPIPPSGLLSRSMRACRRAEKFIQTVDTRFVPTASARLCRDDFLNVHAKNFAATSTGNSTLNNRNFA